MTPQERRALQLLIQRVRVKIKKLVEAGKLPDNAEWVRWNTETIAFEVRLVSEPDSDK